tara:strand:+ start:525 stop:629 length:105 start_codon:yes stop_codon:yes gene_type:complete
VLSKILIDLLEVVTEPIKFAGMAEDDALLIFGNR